MAWSRRPGGGGDQRPGQGGAVPGSLDQDGAAGIGLDAELVDPVVHDRPVAQGAGGQLESLRQRERYKRGRSRASRACARGRPRRSAHGRRCRRGLRRAGPAPGRSPDPGRRAERRARVVAMVASSAQAIFRSGFPLSSLRSRWSPSRTYQPPSGSLAHSPARRDGPRENSGTGVASSPVQPSNAARSSPVRTLMLASSNALRNASSRPRAFGLAGSHRPGAGGEVRLAQPPVLRHRRGVHDRADGVEAVADPAVGGQEGPLGGDGTGDLEQAAGGGR